MVKRKRQSGKHGKTIDVRSAGLVLDDLPEDVLWLIISRLPMRDAARTSIVSRKFKRIWRSYPKMSFDSVNILNYQPESSQGCISRSRTDKFIKNVDAVLQQHSGQGVKELKINFFLSKQYYDHVDRWVNFVVASKAEEIFLDLSPPSQNMIARNHERYNFPLHLFTNHDASYMQGFHVKFISLKLPPRFGGFKNLKALGLHSIDVTKEDLRCLLSNCYVLEWLKIYRCHHLCNLRIPHHLCQLQYLHVEQCRFLETIELPAVNLANFTLKWQRVTSIVLGNSSRVTKACFYYLNSDALHYFLTRLPGDLPHVKTLYFELSWKNGTFEFPKRASIFVHLKHLDLTLYPGGKPGEGEDFLCLASILEAAPYMEKFGLHVKQYIGSHPDYYYYKEEEKRRLPKCPHLYLRIVEISGFFVSKDQIELATHILNNATVLEVMTLDPELNVFYKSIRKLAWKHLCREVPHHAKLVIL